jgi:hypothetical protein
VHFLNLLVAGSGFKVNWRTWSEESTFVREQPYVMNVSTCPTPTPTSLICADDLLARFWWRLMPLMYSRCAWRQLGSVMGLHMFVQVYLLL